MKFLLKMILKLFNKHYSLNYSIDYFTAETFPIDEIEQQVVC